jgi:hypothetical protein
MMAEQVEVLLVAGHQAAFGDLVLALDGLLDDQGVLEPESCGRPDGNRCFERDDPQFQ